MNRCCFIALLLSFYLAGEAQTNEKSPPLLHTGAPKCISFAGVIRLSYPDTLYPLLLNDSADIKASGGTFVIQVYNRQPEAGDSLSVRSLQLHDSIPDNCYQFVKVYTLKKRIRFRQYSCVEGAAGHTYYTYLYKLQHHHKSILLKFTNAHCNSCTDAQGQPVPYNEEKETRWIMLILKSVKLL